MKIKTSLIATNFELLHSAVVDGTIKTNIEIEKVAFVNQPKGAKTNFDIV